MTDHSSGSEAHFGNDIAYLLSIKDEDSIRVRAKLKKECRSISGNASLNLVNLMRDRFKDYHEIKSWLEAENIPFETQFDSKA
jgi:hypothetical protein